MDSVLGAVGVAVKQHFQTGKVPKSEAVSGGILNTLKIGTEHHEIDISGEHGLGRIGLFHMNQNGQAPDQFVRDAFGRKRCADFKNNRSSNKVFTASPFRAASVRNCAKVGIGFQKPYSA
jgi:hypothetical protein